MMGSGGETVLMSPLGGGGGLSNKELMAEARLALSGNWGWAVAGNLLYWLLIKSFFLLLFSGALYVCVYLHGSETGLDEHFSLLAPYVQLLAFIFSGAITVGYLAFFLGISRDQKASLELLFVGFKRFFRSFATYFLVTLFISLWSLLLWIPGIIAAFRYAMAFMVIADEDDCGPLEAIRVSKQIMRGNKWKLFCLGWRFFGWGLLCIVLPFGFLWLIPYMQVSFAKFYDNIR